MKILKDERLEQLSEQVRKGIAIDFADAIEVIKYQSKLQHNKLQARKCNMNLFKRIFRRKHGKGQHQ